MSVAMFDAQCPVRTAECMEGFGLAWLAHILFRKRRSTHNHYHDHCHDYDHMRRGTGRPAGYYPLPQDTSPAHAAQYSTYAPPTVLQVEPQPAGHHVQPSAMSASGMSRFPGARSPIAHPTLHPIIAPVYAPFSSGPAPVTTGWGIPVAAAQQHIVHHQAVQGQPGYYPPIAAYGGISGVSAIQGESEGQGSGQPAQARAGAWYPDMTSEEAMVGHTTATIVPSSSSQQQQQQHQQGIAMKEGYERPSAPPAT